MVCIWYVGICIFHVTYYSEKKGLEGDLRLWTWSTRGKFPWTSLKGACVRSYILYYWIKYTIQKQIQIHRGKFLWTSLKRSFVMSQMPLMMSTSTSTSKNVPKKILEKKKFTLQSVQLHLTFILFISFNQKVFDIMWTCLWHSLCRVWILFSYFLFHLIKKCFIKRL